MLGIILVNTREYKLLLLDIYLPYNICISGGFSKCFNPFKPGAARAPKVLDISNQSLYIFNTVKGLPFSNYIYFFRVYINTLNNNN